MISQKRLLSIKTDPFLMDFQLHAQCEKKYFIVFNQHFKLFSDVELVYQINKIALIAASI